MASSDIVNHQFQKGKPKTGGRTKGVKNAATEFKQILSKKLDKEYAEKLEKEFKKLGLKPKNNREFFFSMIFKRALDGNPKAIETVMSYTFGKPTEHIESDNKIQIEFVDKTDE